MVASEVKDLAQETARATEDISHRVETIQTDTGGAVTAIEQITEVIARISDFQTTIASAVEEQTATTGEMNRSVAEAASGTGDIAQNITGVAAGRRQHQPGRRRDAAGHRRARPDVHRPEQPGHQIPDITAFRVRDKMPLMIFWLDDGFDRAHASSGDSRYAEAVRAHLSDFDESWGDIAPVGFAAAAWLLATELEPAYVRWHPRIMSARCRRNGWDGTLTCETTIAGRWPAELTAGRDWTQDRGWRDWPQTFGQYLTPTEQDIVRAPHLRTLLLVEATVAAGPPAGRARRPGRRGREGRPAGRRGDRPRAERPPRPDARPPRQRLSPRFQAHSSRASAPAAMLRVMPSAFTFRRGLAGGLPPTTGSARV